MTKEETLVKSAYCLDGFSLEKIVDFHKFLLEMYVVTGDVLSYKDQTFNKIRGLVMDFIERENIFIISVFYPGDKLSSHIFVENSLIDIFEFIQNGNWKKRLDGKWEKNRASVSHNCTRISISISDGNMETLTNILLNI